MTDFEMRAQAAKQASFEMAVLPTKQKDEALLAKVLKYAKKLVSKKEDPTLLTKEEFFRRVDEAREEIRQGKGTRFSDPEDMNTWLNSL